VYTSLAINGYWLFFIYIVVCVHHRKWIASPSSILQHQVPDWVLTLHYIVGVEARESLCQPLVGTYCLLAIDGYWLFFIYIAVCVHHRKRIASPSSIFQHQVHRLSAHMVGVELEIYWCQLFIMVTIGIAIVNLRCVVACWIIVSANDGGIIMTVAM